MPINVSSFFFFLFVLAYPYASGYGYGVDFVIKSEALPKQTIKSTKHFIFITKKDSYTVDPSSTTDPIQYGYAIEVVTN